MADNVYTDEVYATHGLVADTFTVPANVRWVVTSIFVFYPGGAVAPAVQIVNHATAVTRFWDSAAISAVGVFRIFSGYRMVFLEGQQFDLLGAGVPDLSVCGYVLSLP